MVSSKDLKYNVNQADLHCNIPKHLAINYVDMNIDIKFARNESLGFASSSIDNQFHYLINCNGHDRIG